MKTLHRFRYQCIFVALLWLSSSTCATAHTQRTKQGRQQPRATKTAEARVAIRESFAAASLNGNTLAFRVLLPAGYDSSLRRYPVLYLLHGAGGGENDWLTRTNLAQYAARYQLIVIMPGVGDSWYANSVSDTAARYEDAIIRDLIPHIDAQYRTLANWHGRAIAGLSMGGAGAMKFALRYPHLFVFAASFSGAFDATRTNAVSRRDERSQNLVRIFGATDSEVRRHNDVFLGVSSLREGIRTPYLYVATGANDPLASVLPSNPRFADALRERKLEYEYHELPGSHDWQFWDTQINSALERMSDYMMHMR